MYKTVLVVLVAGNCSMQACDCCCMQSWFGQNRTVVTRYQEKKSTVVKKSVGQNKSPRVGGKNTRPLTPPPLFLMRCFTPPPPLPLVKTVDIVSLTSSKWQDTPLLKYPQPSSFSYDKYESFVSIGAAISRPATRATLKGPSSRNPAWRGSLTPSPALSTDLLCEPPKTKSAPVGSSQ
jgi:hypothetical protein